MMEKKVTAAMVAKKAGVSPATMSRYLNEKHGVRTESANKIEAAIMETGYVVRPKETGKRLGQPVIVVNLPGIVNTFYNEIIRGIQTSARMHGCHVLIHESALDSGSVDAFCGLLRDIRASGVILLNHIKRDYLDRIHDIAPLVQCSEFNDGTDYPYVSIDDYSAAKKATEHLIACGCNKISIINSSLNNRYARMRQAGFLDAMERAGNSVPSNWVIQLPEISYSLAYSAVCRLLNEDVRPNAFFAVSDIYAVAVLRAASKYQLQVPRNLMVVGFDNLDITAMTCPSVTTVNQASYQAGYSACEMLAEIIEHPDMRPKPILVDTELILRESTYLGSS